MTEIKAICAGVIAGVAARFTVDGCTLVPVAETLYRAALIDAAERDLVRRLEFGQLAPALARATCRPAPLAATA